MGEEMRMNVIGVVDRGAPRKTWRSCVKRDMKAMGIKRKWHRTVVLGEILLGVRPVLARMPEIPCVLGSRTLNEYDDDDDDIGSKEEVRKEFHKLIQNSL